MALPDSTAWIVRRPRSSDWLALLVSSSTWRSCSQRASRRSWRRGSSASNWGKRGAFGLHCALRLCKTPGCRGAMANLGNVLLGDRELQALLPLGLLQLVRLLVQLERSTDPCVCLHEELADILRQQARSSDNGFVGPLLCFGKKRGPPAARPIQARKKNTLKLPCACICYQRSTYTFAASPLSHAQGRRPCGGCVRRGAREGVYI